MLLQPFLLVAQLAGRILDGIFELIDHDRGRTRCRIHGPVDGQPMDPPQQFHAVADDNAQQQDAQDGDEIAKLVAPPGRGPLRQARELRCGDHRTDPQ